MDYSGIALFSDLDGTLFNSRLQISRENREAVKHFIDGGGLFGLATGRSPSNAAMLLEGLSVNTWSVVLGGAEAYDFSTRTVAFPKTLTRIRMAVFIREVLERLPQIDVLVYTESRLFFLSPKDTVDLQFFNTHQPSTFVGLSEALSFPWLKVVFCGPKELIKNLELGAARRGIFDICSPVYITENHLEFLPVGAHKGKCLESLRTMEPLKSRLFVAVGDGSNDLELMEAADVSIAVENAIPEVRQRAKLLTSSNEDHALAHVIYEILPEL